jgi:hypothetical protein
MATLREKLNYKDQQRIAILNSDEIMLNFLLNEFKDIRVDTSIDPRYPYEFMIVFSRFVCEVESLASGALHNLITDGTLWFAFPKRRSKRYSSDLDRDHGWEYIIDKGFDRVRLISLNDDWSALRFKNVRFIRSPHHRFSH